MESYNEKIEKRLEHLEVLVFKFVSKLDDRFFVDRNNIKDTKERLSIILDRFVSNFKEELDKI